MKISHDKWATRACDMLALWPCHAYRSYFWIWHPSLSDHHHPLADIVINNVKWPSCLIFVLRFITTLHWTWEETMYEKEKKKEKYYPIPWKSPTKTNPLRKISSWVDFCSRWHLLFSLYIILPFEDKKQKPLGNWCWFVMGKVCCEESDDGNGGFDPMGLLIALVIALVLMVICSPQPRPAAYAVYRCRWWATPSLLFSLCL